MTPPVIAVFGPTGVGKTAIAIALAERLRTDGEDPVAVSADALQVYAGLETLTGAPTPGQRAILEHRLVGVVPFTSTFSAGEYARRAHAEIDRLLSEGRRPIVVGGTGLYLRAALADLALAPPPPAQVRRHWNEQLEQLGPRGLHTLLSRRDPGLAGGVAPTDSRRIVRSLELLDAGATPPPAPGGPSQLWTAETRHPTLLAGVVMDRAALYGRIDARVDAMVAAGATDEARAARAAGASQTARKALGFEELLQGDVEGMKQRTRQYARRQLTWMRKLPGVMLIDATNSTATDIAVRLRDAVRAADGAGSP